MLALLLKLKEQKQIIDTEGHTPGKKGRKRLSEIAASVKGRVRKKSKKYEDEEEDGLDGLDGFEDGELDFSMIAPTPQYKGIQIYFFYFFLY